MTFPIACKIPSDTQLQHWGCGIRKPLKKAHRQHRRMRDEWVCFLSTHGSVSVIDEIDGTEYVHEIASGEIHIIPPGIWQRSRIDFPVGSQFLWWHFLSSDQGLFCQQDEALTIIDQQLQSGLQDSWLIPMHCDVRDHIEELTLLHKQLMTTSAQWGQDSEGSHTICRHIMHRLHQICVQQLVSHTNDSIPSNDERHIRQAQLFIRENYKFIDSLLQVADELNLNAAYLARCCKRVLNCSVGDLIIEQRIRMAKYFLQHEQVNLKEVANSCGFSSLNYFCRRFKQKTGMSPGVWRRKYQ